MTDSTSILQRLDGQLEALFADWSIYTTLICGVLFLCLTYPLFLYKEPDIHPFLLARQASASYVRQPGESAVYRSLETPHGYPLRSGLNVKDPGAPRWTSGRDGDFRDVWRQALKGAVDAEGNTTGARGKLISVLGREEVIDHDFETLTKDLVAIGQHLKSRGGRRAAIYLPNSTELLTAIFASVFYNIAPILLPYGINVEEVADVLRESGSDCLIAAAGALPLEALLQQYPNIRQVIWVAERSSRHMDWNEVPEGVGGKADIGVWHEIISENRDSVSSDLPSDTAEPSSPKVIIVSKEAKPEKYGTVEFTQKNLVAAAAAQIFSLPKNERLGSADVVLPLTSIADQYTLVIALAALYSNSSLALTSVSGHTVEYSTAFRGIAPTVIIATPPTMLKVWEEKTKAPKGMLEKVDHWNRSRVLAAGSMPKAPVARRSPRLIFVPERSGQTSLTSEQLFDLRISTGAHIAHAFTDRRVAGAISQVNIFDYRRSIDGRSHLGPPMSCLEVKLVDSSSHKVTDGSDSAGLLVVEGPAVVDDRIVLGQPMTFTESNTLS
ncbi:MAG: hypothetical protein Q9191_006568, partial [Dirinaria sp. TL-2023a]